MALDDCPVVPWVTLCGPLPGSFVFQCTGRGCGTVTSGSCSEAFLPPPRRAALATKLYSWLPAVLPLIRGGFRPDMPRLLFPIVGAPARETGILLSDWLLRKDQRGPFFFFYFVSIKLYCWTSAKR